MLERYVVDFYTISMRFILFPAVFVVICQSVILANPEVPKTVAVGYGQATSDNLLLLKGEADRYEPTEWLVFGRDPFRRDEQVSLVVTLDKGRWSAEPSGLGSVLRKVPTRVIDFSLVKERSSDALKVAKKAAELAQAEFSRVGYQLATNAETGVPEWGMALMDATGYEVGFCIVSAQTGALLFQSWTPLVEERDGLLGGLRPRTEEEEGERAAHAVKKGVRKAWDWSENAGKQTGNFFRELFR